MPIMLSSENCNEQIPVEEINQTIRFSQVIALNAVTEDGKVVPISLSSGSAQSSVPGRQALKEYIAVPAHRMNQMMDRHAGDYVYLGDWLARQQLSKEQKRIELDVDFHEFIAEPVKTIEKHQIQFELDEDVLTELREEGQAEFITTYNGEVVRIVVRLVRKPKGSKAVAKKPAYRVEKVPVNKTGRTRDGITTSNPSPLPVSLVIPFTQTWTLKGYRRGNLLNSIALAPLEEVSVDVFSWYRRKSSMEDAMSQESESVSEVSQTARDSLDIENELKTQNENNSGVQLQGSSVSVMEVVNVNVNGGFNVDNKRKMEDSSKRSRKQFNEMVAKAVRKVKSSRVTKVTESVEVGREDRNTRKIRNPNTGRTLTFHYFEVEACYQLATHFDADDIGLCVRVANPIDTAFTRGDILLHETTLKGALIERSLMPAFEACRMLEAREAATELLRTQRSRLLASMPPPPPPPSGQQIEPEVAAMNSAASQVVSRFNEFVTAYGLLTAANVNDELKKINDKPESDWRPQLSTIKQNVGRWVYLDAFKRASSDTFGAIEQLKSATSDESKLSAADQLSKLAFPSGANWTRGVDEAKEEVMGRTRLLSIPGYVLPLVGVAPVAAVAAVLGSIAYIAESGWWAKFVADERLNEPNDAGLFNAFSRVVNAMEAYSSAKAKAVAAQAVKNDPATEDKEEISLLQMVQSDEQKLDLAYPLSAVASAITLEKTLIAHLRLHAHHYRYAIFRAQYRNAQIDTSLLAGSALQGFAGTISPVPIGYDGSNLLLRVLSSSEDIATFLAAMKDILRKTYASEKPDNMILPTPGIAMESRLGCCETVEPYLTESRDVEIDKKKAENVLLKRESERLKARIEAEEPLLDDPRAAAALRVELVGREPK